MIYFRSECIEKRLLDPCSTYNKEHHIFTKKVLTFIEQNISVKKQDQTYLIVIS